MTIRLLGVGAAAPRRRLAAADIGAAWGRGAGAAPRPCAHPTRTRSPSPGTPRPPRSPRPASTPRTSTRMFWGTSRPPFAEGPSLAFLAAALGCSHHVGGALAAGSAHAGMEALTAAADAVAAGSAQRRARRRVRRAPARARHRRSKRAAAPGAAAVVLARRRRHARRSARASRARRPFVDRYRGDGEIDNRDLYDARLFREEIFLPDRRRGRRRARRRSTCSAWSLPDPDGRLGAVVAKQVGARRAGVGRGVRARSATPARPPRCSARVGALDAPGTVAIVGTGGGRTTGVLVHVDAPVPGAAAVADALDGGRPASYAEAAARPRPARARRRDDPDGRAARERDVRARRRRDARPARRPLRRLRHDQHAAVDPPARASAAAARSSSRSRSHAAARCTPTWSTTRCPRRSSRRCRSRCSTWTTARA